MFTGSPTFPNMSLLRQFIEVADEKGMARAARRLNMTQPALSKNVKRLEAMLGAELFDRHSKGTALTQAGQVFYQRATKIILEYEHALREVQNTLSDDAGILRVGAGPVFASTILPAALPAFLAHYPRYRVSIRTLTVEDLGEELELGKIDMITSAILKLDSDNFIQQTLRRVNLSILCRENHPLAVQQSPVPLASITQFPFVSFEPDHDLIRKLTQILSRHEAPPPRYVVETSSIFGATDLLRNSDSLFFGSALLPDYPLGHGLCRLNLDTDLGDYAMGIVIRKDKDDVPAYRGFANIIRQQLQ